MKSKRTKKMSEEEMQKQEALAKMKEYRPPYGENMIRIVGAGAIDIETLMGMAEEIIHEDEVKEEEKKRTGRGRRKKDEAQEEVATRKVIKIEREGEDKRYNEAKEEWQLTVLEGKSAVGVDVITGKAESEIMIRVPWLTSIGDIDLAYAYLQAAKRIAPWCNIFMDEVDDKAFEVREENKIALMTRHFMNMKSLVERSRDGFMIAVVGFKRDMMIGEEKWKVSQDEEMEAIVLMDQFAKIQWEYKDYATASHIDVKAKDGEEYTARVVSNSMDTFFGVCQHVVMMRGGNEVKDVPIEVFEKAVEGCKYYRRVDCVQFVMKKMPEAEWNELFEKVEGKVIRRPKTYLLRWNPGISSFKIETYKMLTKKYPEGFKMNWSVYEWEEAKEGDRYYMLRTGDDKAGIVWAGEFLSDPYEGEDWAGKGQPRHYMDIGCWRCVDAKVVPPVDLEKLEKEIPSIDWRTGHSGQLMTEEEAEKMEKLWKGKGKGEKGKGEKKK
ncbi:MAG: hypothetical protein II951_13640 [Bacteroidales bacterium]|nr:hypothetical protein [Bacteroidales bacterium]